MEFISDRQLEFYTEQEELQPFEVCAQVVFIQTDVCGGVLLLHLCSYV